MIHCEILDEVANRVVAQSGYDKDIMFQTNTDRKSCDIKTWLTMCSRQMNFSFGEVADYLNMTEDGVFKYMERHRKRMNDKDYQLKWQIIKQIINE